MNLNNLISSRHRWPRTLTRVTLSAHRAFHTALSSRQEKEPGTSGRMRTDRGRRVPRRRRRLQTTRCSLSAQGVECYQTFLPTLHHKRLYLAAFSGQFNICMQGRQLTLFGALLCSDQKVSTCPTFKFKNRLLIFAREHLLLLPRWWWNSLLNISTAARILEADTSLVKLLILMNIRLFSFIPIEEHIWDTYAGKQLY
jgi:hypothetical protein